MVEENQYAQQIHRLRKRISELERQVHTDELTNILNRRGLMQMLEAFVSEVDFQLKNPDRRQFLIIKSFSLIFIDIDFFKKINDEYGHDGGDAVLREVATTIRGALRGIDLVGRYGGEELVVGLVGAAKDKAREIAEDLRSKIEALRVTHKGQTIKVTASFGVSTVQEGVDLDEVIKQADESVYEAKAQGRNRVVVYGDS